MRFTPTGVETWSLPPLLTQFDNVLLTTGSRPYNIAGSPTGRIAVVGDYAAVLSGTGWVQVYVP